MRYTTNEDIRSVVKYLEALEDKKDESLPEIHEIEMFMRFFEEIDCLIQAKSIKENIVYYMFGHYVLLFEKEKDNFPKELEYDKGFWVLFRKFVERMKKAETSLYDNPKEKKQIKEKRIKL